MGKYPATVLAVVFAVSFQIIHQDVMAEEELSEYLWKETEKYHNEARDSHFIQGLKNAALDPTEFGAYNVQDAIFCYVASESFVTAADRTADANLKQFLQDRAKSYQREYEGAFKDWHINDATGISLGSACDNYVNHLRNVAKTMEPTYLAVALIPCVRLWPWLGQQINGDSGKFGVYNKWVVANLNPKYDGYKKYEKVINDAFKKGTITKTDALKVYEESMKGEVAFFSSTSSETQTRSHDEF